MFDGLSTASRPFVHLVAQSLCLRTPPHFSRPFVHLVVSNSDPNRYTSVRPSRSLLCSLSDIDSACERTRSGSEHADCQGLMYRDSRSSNAVSS